MRISLAFGKRDHKKYKQVIEWLDNLDEGWVNEEIKEALLFYVENKNLQSSSNYIDKNNDNLNKSNNSNTLQSIKSNNEKPDDNYVEIPTTKNNEEENIEIPSSIDSFLGEF